MYFTSTNTFSSFFFFQAEDGIRDYKVTGVQTCALPIWAASEKAKSGLLGEAYKLSQKIRGEGEARAAKIYADSFARAPEFYRFVRSMDAMKKAVGKETTLVLPVDSELFRLLQDSRYRFPEH